jgi:hypothetical protein
VKKEVNFNDWEDVGSGHSQSHPVTCESASNSIAHFRSRRHITVRVALRMTAASSTRDGFDRETRSCFARQAGRPNRLTVIPFLALATRGVCDPRHTGAGIDRRLRHV